MTKDTTGSLIARLPSAKFWPPLVQKCQQHKMYQEIQRLRTNPDTRKKYPAECRNNPEGRQILHPETKIRLLKDLESKLKGTERPTTITPTRYNRK